MEKNTKKSKQTEEPYLGPIFKEKNLLQKYYIEIIIFLIGIIAIHIFLGSETFSGESLNANNASQYGDFLSGYVGSLFGLISIILIFTTFKTQRESSEIDKFETRFFELIRLHRENVKEISVTNQDGKKIFVLAIREFREIHVIVKKIFTKEELSIEDILNISYLTLYYGVGWNSSRILKNSLSNYNEEKVNKLIKKLESKHKKLSSKEKSKIKKIPSYVKAHLFFGGHQSRLGHYYRHLFQAITFCHNKGLDIDKYVYVKLIRAQLSNHEQALLALNSISDLGKPWNKKNDTGDDGLIHTYRLIKNIPKDFFHPSEEFDIKTLFPKMVFEYNEKKHKEKKVSLLGCVLYIKKKPYVLFRF